ncbi:helicase-associated domain-containing protein [candidate division KSB1 bacterium]|nr:helicase-associated domain-containing protein [candidate division KSB1 bacterium]
MNYQPENPLFVQSDRTILLEVNNPRFEEARDNLGLFAELEKSPEHIHTYRLTPLSLWNAASAGLSAERILEILSRFSKYDTPQNIQMEIIEQMSRYGRIKLIKENDNFYLISDDSALVAQIWHNRSVKPFLQHKTDSQKLLINPMMRGHVKQALIKIGFPVQDMAGYVEGDFFQLEFRTRALSDQPFHLRHYQVQSVDTFYANGSTLGGSGVIVLPCGAGKTIVGIGVTVKMKTQVLVLATSTVAVRQWINEFLDKTTIAPRDIGEYTGETKTIRPITVATYQILTYRKRRSSEFPHFKLFNERNWGLIIYDEVHLLPAPVFRVTAELQARRRLGLTATLVREDGREGDVFSLIGPKKYDVPWKILEKQGWIANAICTEIRLKLPEKLRMQYAISNMRAQFRIASENPDKLKLIKTLMQKYDTHQILIIGQYIEQLSKVAESLNLILITGKTTNLERMQHYADFRAGKIRVLVISKVGNFAIDLPDANVLIQISGTFGSRQEEAQRLGRILRPKRDGSSAYFYTLVTRDTREQDFASKRQLFLTEQGYAYNIIEEKNIYET